MTAITNTATTLTTIGIREDLENTIYRVSPEKTPLVTSIGKGVAATTAYHEWQTEALDAPSDTNYNLEGNDYGTTYGAENVTTRVGNYNQIFVKTGVVSGTDEIVKKAGRGSELARQKMLKMLALRTDMEKTFLGNKASNNESGGTPRKCAGIRAWITSNASYGTGGSAGGFANGVVAAATPGTARTFTFDMVKSVRNTAFNNGANPTQAYMPGSVKDQWAAFTGAATNFVSTKADGPTTLMGSVDVYQDSYGALKLIPHPYAFAGNYNAIVFVDPAMLAVGTLRGTVAENLAKTGDATKFSVLAEKTLVVRNEKAHAVIHALN